MSEVRISLKTAAVVPERPPLWMHAEDRQVKGYLRSCAPCPAVWVLYDDPHVVMNRPWQLYLVGINYNMTLENVYLILDDHLAFANRTGFQSLATPGRNDYIFNRTGYASDPRLDKVRTCSRSVMTGVEAYSLVQAFKDVMETARKFSSILGSKRQAFVRAATSLNVLKVQMFDSRKPPPLKPGRVQPTRVEDVNIDDYLYTPRTHPWMFFVANIVNAREEVVQFPRGATYSWFEDGRTPATFVPHIYNPNYGEVLYPLRNLVRVTGNIPSPYRRLA